MKPDIRMKPEGQETEKYVDVHTHKRGKDIYLLDISDGKRAEEGELCSAGIHPMFIGKSEPIGRIEEWAERKRIVAVGEAGFDRNSETGIAVQTELFEAEVRISEAYGLPLIIHCVKAFPELLAVYKKMRPGQAWIIHGYNNNRQILDELLKHGLYISAGKKVFVETSNIRQLLPFIPLEQLFIETDDSDYTIEEVYAEVAGLLHIPLDVLIRCMYRNWLSVFSGI